MMGELVIPEEGEFCLYLDDIRQAPGGWVRAYTADQAIEALKTGRVSACSLDHDLGDGAYDDGPTWMPPPVEKTGYDVVLWMAENNVWPRTVMVHSANPKGKADMVRTIKRFKGDYP